MTSGTSLGTGSQPARTMIRERAAAVAAGGVPHKVVLGSVGSNGDFGAGRRRRTSLDPDEVLLQFRATTIATGSAAGEASDLPRSSTTPCAST